MGKSLVIVESPTKSKTIKKYLGSDYVVKASVGHVKNLPKKELGVDIENDFEPKYVTIRGKGKIIAEIRKEAMKADNVYLATDPDREGEAIAWHIAQEVDGKSDNVYRLLIHEITKKAVQAAIENPDNLDRDKYNAQQARRILDRLVGYKISPILWKKVRMGLSAGRVQSVAVRLVCERERDIQKFVPQEYWSIIARLEAKNPPIFEAKLLKIDSAKAKIENEGQAKAIVNDVKIQEFIVDKVDKKERRKFPVPPFITSKLQQEAARKLGFSNKKTMMMAQRLYEGIELGPEGSVGLITYMRTDSTRISSDALGEVRGYITDKYGLEFLPEEPIVYKNKKSAQDAHEAIRPTSLQYEPDAIRQYLGKDEFAMYQLIWKRFVACQMKPAVYDQTIIDIQAGKCVFRASGSVLKFEGFIKVYVEGKDNGNGEDDNVVMLPEVVKGELLKLLELIPKQHFTEPPPRFTQSTLVKELEEKGIGRPSTFAIILSNIQDRKYVILEQGKFYPTELGSLVTDLLVENFPDILNVEFTATMEEKFDEIEEGKVGWIQTLREFYDPFNKDLQRAKVLMRDVKAEVIETNIDCEQCGKKMVIKWGRHGKFLACSAYPECKTTGEFTEDESGEIKIKEAETTDEVCELCKKPMAVKMGRFGKFLACSGYPDCKNTKPITLGIKCPEEDCKGEVVPRRTKRGRIFYGCTSYPDCNFASWELPMEKTCPHCGFGLAVEKNLKTKGHFFRCVKCKGEFKPEKSIAEEEQKVVAS